MDHILKRASLKALNHNVNWIQDVVESPTFKKGAFTKKAKKAGYKTKAYMTHVLEHPDLYDETTRRQAQFMRNIIKKD